MNFQNPYPCRLAPGLVPLLVMWLAVFGSAEEYAPVVEDRVEPIAEQPPIVEDTAKKSGGWDLSAVISAAYDDNIFLSSANPKSDMVFRAAPSVAYTHGDEEEGEGGFVKAGYRPTLVLYAENGSSNRVDQEAVLVTGWRGKVTRVTYSGAVRQLGDATPETGSPTDRLVFSNEIRGAWHPREKVALEIGGGFRGETYEEGRLYDSKETYGVVAVRYYYSPKTVLGIAYQAGRLRVEDSPSQDTRQLTAEILWQPREKVRFSIRAGAEHRKTESGSEVNPVLEGRVDWTPRESTEVYLAGFMREQASSFYAGQNYSVRGFAAGMSQRINAEWDVKLEGGHETNDYGTVSGSGTAGRGDRMWFVRPALVWRLAEESDLTFFYRISSNDSNEGSFGYDQQVVGVEFNHTF